MKAFFITGTDTGVGKTVVAGLAGRFLSDKGYSVITQKWIQTGSSVFPDDIGAHLRLMKKTKKSIKAYLPLVCPYTFKVSSSPHMASRIEKRKIDIKKIKNSFHLLSEQFDFVIVEGIGGGLVPLNEHKLVIDVARDLSLSVLLVASNRLGAINHTLLTVEAIKRRNMKIAGIIFNNSGGKHDKAVLEDNPKIVGRITGEKILGVLPRVNDRNKLYKAFVPIALNLFNLK
ncbi:MAG: dethiobiotin synthase [Omnitrophica bacterium]|nr:dethiobiotin synthase [Candidatus Omnitrophota bacterium]